MMKKINFEAFGSGRWFPEGKNELTEMVSRYISDAKVPNDLGDIESIIAPHAGGGVAGYSFKALECGIKKYDTLPTVVVVGFSHHSGFGSVKLLNADTFTSPIGTSPIDKESSEMLITDGISFDNKPHVGEHSAENEIPFIQSINIQIPLIVALFGTHDVQLADTFVNQLIKLSEKKKIFVVSSSDMLHNSNYNLVKSTDASTLQLLKNMDTDTLMKQWSYRNQVLCGIMPVYAAIEFARKKGCNIGRILNYSNSADVMGNKYADYVVGYGAIAYEH